MGWGWGSVTRPACKGHRPPPLLTQLIFSPYLLRDPICGTGGLGGRRGGIQLKAAGKGRLPHLEVCPWGPPGTQVSEPAWPLPGCGLRHTLLVQGPSVKGAQSPLWPSQHGWSPQCPQPPGEPLDSGPASPCIRQSPGGHGAAALRCLSGVKLSPQRPQEGLRAMASLPA